MLSGNWLCQVAGTYLVTFDVKLNPSTTANIELYVDNVGTGFGIEVNDLTRTGTDVLSQTAILSLKVGQEVSLMNHAGTVTGTILFLIKTCKYRVVTYLNIFRILFHSVAQDRDRTGVFIAVKLDADDSVVHLSFVVALFRFVKLSLKA